MSGGCHVCLHLWDGDVGGLCLVLGVERVWRYDVGVCLHLWIMLCVGLVGIHFTSLWEVRTEHFVKSPRAEGAGGIGGPLCRESLRRRASACQHALVGTVPGGLGADIRLESAGGVKLGS